MTRKAYSSEILQPNNTANTKSDGHDKIGFPVWAVVDDATGKWLDDAYVVPNNWLGEVIGYLFLCLVEKYRVCMYYSKLEFHTLGKPLQFSTDCGSETTQLYGLVNALQFVFQISIFYPEYDLEELPAHIYHQSVHNISIEQQWLRLRMDWGNTVILDFNKGIMDGLYNSQNPQQYWLQNFYNHVAL
ncbi:hypothetical protein L208DRAFT_1381107 [Tricholoma matsutake]|nr:hypothetical protein L208DRAFT_1381107 [Tricholoma matsutake 945]